MPTHPKSLLTPEQYLEIERKAEYKSEYLAGEMFAMSGASRAHNYLTLDLAVILHPQVQQRGCRIFTGDIRIQVAHTGLCTYPDVIVVCGGEPQFAGAHVDTLLNPAFVAEALSPSTEAYDRGRKFEHYLTIESLGEYLLIAQDRSSVDLYRRGPDTTWSLLSSDSAQDTLELQSIRCRVPMAELYRQVDVPPGV